MKKLFIISAILAVLGLATTSVFGVSNMVSLICIDYVQEANDEELITEYYEGSGALDLTIPCLTNNLGAEITTDNIYGLIAVDSGPSNQGYMYITLDPSRGADYGIPRLFRTLVWQTGAFIGPGMDGFVRTMYYFPQYTGTKLHLTWANASNVNWKITLYRKGRE